MATGRGFTKNELKSLLTLALMRHISPRSETTLDPELFSVFETALSGDLQADIGLVTPEPGEQERRQRRG